jgi:predicted RNA-binding protein YlxR (DUF448 family)
MGRSMVVKKRKHVPQRTCVGCREVLPKRSLIRIVRTEEGVKIDPTGKLAGRGAYLHDRRSCWQNGLQNALSNALKTELQATDLDYLETFMFALPEE